MSSLRARLRHPELLLVVALFAIVNLASAAFQSPIAVHDGQGWDGAAYYTVAQQLAQGQHLAAEAPFVERVGTPLLAELVARDDLVAGFRLVNIAANAVLTLLLLVWLRRYVGDWRIRVGLIAAFLLEWHGPVRFVHFYPVAADNWFACLLLGGLLAIEPLVRRGRLALIGGLGLLTMLAVVFRESGLLLGLVAPFAANPLRFERRLPRVGVALFVPLVLGLGAFVGLHALTTATNTPTTAGGAQPLIVPKSLPAYLLGWWTAFGPLLILPLVAWRRSLAFLWRHQVMLALLGVLTLMSAIQSPGLQLQLQDTERYLFWGMPVVYVLVGRALEALLPLLGRPLLGLLVLAQLVAERAFWPIPQPGGGDPSQVFERSTSAWLVFTPLGPNVQYFDLFPAWMSQAYRLILLGEYLGLAAVVVGWLAWQSARQRRRVAVSVPSSSSLSTAEAAR